MAKQYDLEERTEKFAKDVIQLCKKLPKNTINFKLIEQAVSSGMEFQNQVPLKIAHQSYCRRRFS